METHVDTGRTGAPQKPKSNLPVIVGTIVLVGALSFTAGTRAEQIPGYGRLFNNGSSVSAPANLDFSSVQQTYDVLRAKYDGKLDPAKLVEGANRGLVEATGDPYTTYLNAEDAKALNADLGGQFEGIGAQLNKKDNNVFIEMTLGDSPAQKAGLQAGDVIMKVNGKDATGWSIGQAVKEIRGQKGTTVKLGVLRGGTEPKEFSIVRATIVDPSVKPEITADNIGIMRISRFGESETYQLAQQAAQDFKNKNVKGVVVDLRGNGGGYLSAAQDLAGLWLNNKVVVTERRGTTVTDTLRTGTNPILQGIPTVVLVDGGSASASEILAGALRDNGAAKIVGQKTFGKGSVQTIEQLPDGAQLKVTIRKWYTPNGVNVNQDGIKPDVEVGITADDISAGRDPQLDRAKQEAAR